MTHHFYLKTAVQIRLAPEPSLLFRSLSDLLGASKYLLLTLKVKQSHFIVLGQTDKADRHHDGTSPSWKCSWIQRGRQAANVREVGSAVRAPAIGLGIRGKASDSSAWLVTKRGTQVQGLFDKTGSSVNPRPQDEDRGLFLEEARE